MDLVVLHDRRRNSLRAGGYDYSLPGSYFVTICVDDRSLRFGDIVEMRMVPNDAGLMVAREWEQLPERFLHIDLDAFVVMPNHLHGIVVIMDLEDDVAPESEDGKGSTGVGMADGSLSRVVQAFKSITTREYGIGVRERGWPRFESRLWQRSFYDHIICGDHDLNRVRAYITDNPTRRFDDREYLAWKESQNLS